MSPTSAARNTASQEPGPTERGEDLEARASEMRHRFRNSLQFLNSLVGLHSRQVKDPEARQTFKDLRARLVTVAWIFDGVDNYGDEPVPLAEFLPRLARHVSSGSEPHTKCTLAFKIDALSLEPQRASALAQILSEVLGSLLRSAGAAPSSIEIELVEIDRQCELTVSSSGEASKHEPASADPVARTLVESLIRNLSGELLTPAAPAGSWRLRWPLQAAA